MTDFSRWARRREGCREDRTCAAQREHLGPGPLPGLEDSCDTAGSKHEQKDPPAYTFSSQLPLSPCKPQWFWEECIGIMPGSVSVYFLVP